VEFHDFPWHSHLPWLENSCLKFHDFPGYVEPCLFPRLLSNKRRAMFPSTSQYTYIHTYIHTKSSLPSCSWADTARPSSADAETNPLLRSVYRSRSLLEMQRSSCTRNWYTSCSMPAKSLQLAASLDPLQSQHLTVLIDIYQVVWSATHMFVAESGVDFFAGWMFITECQHQSNKGVPPYFQGGHFPVSIKFPELLFSQERRRIFKGGGTNTRRVLTSWKFFECIPYVGTKSRIWAPNLAYIFYREGNLIVIEKCYSWHTKGKNTFSLTFRISPDHFKIPWLFQVGGHPVLKKKMSHRNGNNHNIIPASTVTTDCW